MKLPNMDQITAWSPLLAECIQSIGGAIDTLGQKSSFNPQGGTVKPTPPSAINVTASPSGIHRVSITDNSPRTRAANNFVEHSIDPNFGPDSVQVEHLGVARQRSIPQSMGTTPVYYRAYTAYPDGARSDIIYFGGATNPTGVVDNAPSSVVTDVTGPVTASLLGPPHHPSTGSGTSSTGGYGFGRESFVSAPAAPGKSPKIFQ